MLKRKMIPAVLALAVAGVGMGAAAQQGPGAGPRADRDDRPGHGMRMERPHGPPGHGAMMDERGPGPGHGPMGPHMMGPGMMTMMMAMMDTDGDRALSLEEVQAVHARLFGYADADGDGKLTPEEMIGFMHGGAFDEDR